MDHGSDGDNILRPCRTILIASCFFFIMEIRNLANLNLLCITQLTNPQLDPVLILLELCILCLKIGLL